MVVEVELVDGDLLGQPGLAPSGVDGVLPAVQGLLPLGVGELQAAHAAVAFDDSHAVELARGVAISRESKWPQSIWHCWPWADSKLMKGCFFLDGARTALR